MAASPKKSPGSKGKAPSRRMTMLPPRAAGDTVGCTFVVWLYFDPPPDDVCITLSDARTETKQALKARSKATTLGVYYAEIISVPEGTCGPYILNVCVPQRGGSCADDPST